MFPVLIISQVMSDTYIYNTIIMGCPLHAIYTTTRIHWDALYIVCRKAILSSIET